jgi:3-deoxy-D-manno-octulosonate 8-phosphate phosphatase (KDO 8-P phosphatase)
MMNNELTPATLAKFSQVEILVLDVDGVLTDGGLYYTEKGEQLKKFNVKDGLGLKRVMQRGVTVAILSASVSQATLHRARHLGIFHVFIDIEDKLAQLKDLCDKLGVDLDHVAYLGDDLVDLPAMQAVGCPIAVADAMPENQAAAIYVTRCRGGEGAVREVCDLICLNA